MKKNKIYITIALLLFSAYLFAKNKKPKSRVIVDSPIKQPYDWNVLKMAARGGSSTVPSTFTCVGHVAFTRAIKQASPAARPKMEPIIIVRTTRHGSSSWWSYGSLSGTRSPLDYAPGTHMTPFMSCLAWDRLSEENWNIRCWLLLILSKGFTRWSK